jgi:hypothetical protein
MNPFLIKTSFLLAGVVASATVAALKLRNDARRRASVPEDADDPTLFI